MTESIKRLVFLISLLPCNKLINRRILKAVACVASAAVFLICLSHCIQRDLDARAKSERYRALFRLPKDEKLDGHTDCTLWTPFNKMHILGQMFVSTNYICFTSKEETMCSLIIPLREASCLIYTRLNVDRFFRNGSRAKKINQLLKKKKK